MSAYSLPSLKFAYDALEPVIDAETLRLHHGVLHRGYVEAVNAALQPHPDWQGLTIEALLRRMGELPEPLRTTVRGPAGGHANHQFFWKLLSPEAPAGPSGALSAALVRDFGSVDAFKAEFERVGRTHAGVGWVFLVAKPRRQHALEIVSLPDEESVLTLADPSPGLICCDLWEHAYYARYWYGRAEWLRQFWRILNWDYVGERLQGVLEGRAQL